MEIILVAILVLVLLSPLDASRWARDAKSSRRAHTASRTRPKAARRKSRRRSRRTASAHMAPTLSFATPRSSTATRARWWWE